MNNVNLENNLLVVNVVDVMVDYVSIQPDADESKIKAAWTVAQRIDLKKQLPGGDKYIDIAREATNEVDLGLKTLMIETCCYYCYARCLKMFQGTFTDSGYIQETESTDRNIAKSVSNEMRSIGETYMCELLEYIQEYYVEDEDTVEAFKKPSIRVIGGKEIRS